MTHIDNYYNNLHKYQAGEIFYKLCAGYEPPRYEQHIKPRGIYKKPRKINREVTIKEQKYISTWMGKVPARVIADQLGLNDDTIYNHFKKLKQRNEIHSKHKGTTITGK